MIHLLICEKCGDHSFEVDETGVWCLNCDCNYSFDKVAEIMMKNYFTAIETILKEGGDVDKFMRGV